LSAHNASKVIELHKGMTFEDRLAAGKALRNVCPRNAHAIWKAPAVAGGGPWGRRVGGVGLWLGKGLHCHEHSVAIRRGLDVLSR
jgi:hypothetical protein